MRPRDDEHQRRLAFGAVRTYAGYLASRNGALAIGLIAAMWLRARRMLNTLMLLTAFIQSDQGRNS